MTDIKMINWRLIIFLALSLLIVKAIPPLLVLVYGMLAVHAVRGPRQVIEAFSIMFIFLMANPSLVPPGGKTLRWIVFFAGFAQTIWLLVFRSSKDNYNTNKVLFGISILTFSLIPISLVASKITTVSILKLIAFYMGVSSILIGYQKARTEAQYWYNWFHTLLLFIIFASCTVFFFGMGFEKNGRGFQGIFNHPQVLGALSGLLAAWFSGHSLFAKKSNAVMIVATIFSWAFIFFSQARIGLVTVILGLFLSNFIYFVNTKRIPRRKRIFNLSLLLVLAAIAVAIFFPNQLVETSKSFVQKRNENAALSEAFQESRGFLIDASMANFYKYPVFGIGFGIPTNYDGGLLASSDALTGLPTSTSVEKGFLPSAILEETGLFGAFSTIYVLTLIINQVLTKGHFHLLWILLSVLLINIAEAVFYSIGGMGLMVWLITGYCLALSQNTYKPEVSA